MIRLIVALAFLVLLLALINRLLSWRCVNKQNPPNARVSKMVKCDYCRLYIPEATAIKQDSEHFCSDEHRQSALIRQDE